MPLQGNYNNPHHNNDDTIYYEQVRQHRKSLQANTILMERLTRKLKDKENKK